MSEKATHPATLDHSTETLLRLAKVARDLSHEVDAHFDDLQDIRNLLMDWAAVKEGYALTLLDGQVISIFAVDGF